MRWVRALSVLTLVAGMLLTLGVRPERALAADVVVGQGAYGCDRDGLATAVADAATTDPNAPGRVTFDCDDPTITFEEDTAIGIGHSATQAVVIDGSNGDGPQIVLQGGGDDYQTNFFDLDEDGTLTVQRLTMQDGNASAGGTILNAGGTVTVIACTFMNNQAKTSGVIENSGFGSVTVRQSRFFGNQAETGGVIWTNGTLTISQSSFVDNTATLNHGGVVDGNAGTVVITSSTFSGNTAAGSGSVIYLHNYIATSASISWSTIFQPEDTTSALDIRASLTLTGVILGGSEDDHCAIGGGALSVSFSLTNDESCEAGSQSWESQDLQLGSLATSMLGGVVQSYYPLLADSPAINGGSPTCDTAIDADTDSDPDQLGTPRPYGDRCDVGAFEALPTVDAGGPYTGNEGVAVALNGSASDPDNNVLTYLWTYAPGTGTDSGTSCTFADAAVASTTITCNDDGPFTLTLTVNVPSGTKVVDQADLTLANVAPVISDFYASPNPALTGQLVNLTLTVDDVENDRVDMYQRIYFECNGGVQVSDGQCRYDQGGSYQIKVSVRDADGGSSSQSFILQVYDEATLCANSWTGQLRMVDEGDACGRSEHLIQLPEDGPESLCVNQWNGSASVGGDCGRSEYLVQVNGQDTLAVCVNRWNGSMRVSERCSRSEVEDWL